MQARKKKATQNLELLLKITVEIRLNCERDNFETNDQDMYKCMIGQGALRESHSQIQFQEVKTLLPKIINVTYPTELR